MSNIKYTIQGKARLEGEVKVSGAKNSALRLLAASILTSESVTLIGCPVGLQDAKVHIEMLRSLGKHIEIFDDTITIKETKEISSTLEWDGPSIRNTLLIAGALFSRFGHAKVPFPGGCRLGDRKIDLHLKLYSLMGAEIIPSDTHIILTRGKSVKGDLEFRLPLRSSGATENALIMSCFGEVNLKIINPHVRPEIMDLIEFLNKLGGNILTSGQDFFLVKEGSSCESSIMHKVVPDNVEAITWLIATIITKGKVTIKNFPHDHLEMPMVHIKQGASRLEVDKDDLIVLGKGSTSFELATGPYPGINSDMQALFAGYGLLAEGDSRIIDLRFLDRFQYADALQKLGASLEVDGNELKIYGGKNLESAKVVATDIRGGMAMVLAALVADGKTEIDNMYQVERGYEKLDLKLAELGVNVVRHEE